MESARTYTFRIILFLGIFISGIIAGKIFATNNKKSHTLNSISAKRFYAIKQAMEEGKTEYNFEVGYTPVLNK